MKVAVLVHTGKSIGAGPDELRTTLADAGVTDPAWFEVPKSKKAPKQAKRAVREGAELVFVWGGDGMVQRTADALAGSGIPLAIVPAGTANLLATNLGIPKDIAACVKIGLSLCFGCHGHPNVRGSPGSSYGDLAKTHRFCPFQPVYAITH
jgi:diacylglycerol kinase family enzyme